MESLAVADCQSEQIVVGVWASGSVWAFRQATGETTGHWGRTIERGHRRWPTNIVTVDDDGTQLAAVADDTELLLFELPTLAVRVRHPDAAKSSLYSLAVARWNNRTVIVSGGEADRQRGHAESYPVKLWDIGRLKCLLEGGDDLLFASSVLPLEVGGESFLLCRALQPERFSDWPTSARRPQR